MTENKIDLDAQIEKISVDAGHWVILDEAYKRYQAAEKKYGVLDIEKDPRNFLKEAEEELLDIINYAAFEIARLRLMDERLTNFLNRLEKAVLKLDKDTAEEESTR